MISLVSTIFNDRAGAELFFQRMASQTRPPEEIVIVDSNSKDGTWEVLQAEMARPDRPWQLVAWQERCNVARGRNLAIERAAGPVIASTDLGCDWDPEWLEELTAPLLADPRIGVVMGSWAVPEAWAKSVWAKTEYAYWPSMKLEAKPDSFASSRSIAYRKAIWQQIGGYPEDLTLAGDDACFATLLRKFKVPAAAAPTVRCYWHRHETLQAFLKEQYRYFLGDGEAAMRDMHFVRVGGRLAVEALGAASIVAGFLWPAWRPVCLIVASLGVASFLLRLKRLPNPARRLSARGVSMAWLRLIAYDYLTKLWGLAGYARGYLRGWVHCQEIRRRLSV